MQGASKTTITNHTLATEENGKAQIDRQKTGEQRKERQLQRKDDDIMKKQDDQR